MLAALLSRLLPSMHSVEEFLAPRELPENVVFFRCLNWVTLCVSNDGVFFRLHFPFCFLHRREVGSPRAFPLAAGRHTLTVQHREDGAFIRAVALTGAFFPRDGTPGRIEMHHADCRGHTNIL